MRSKVFIIILLLAISFFGVNSAAPQTPVQLNPGADMKIRDVSGKKFSIEPIEGKLLIIDFWATWCGPCRKAIPKLVEIQKTYPEKVQVVGISVDREISFGELQDFYQTYRINYPVGFATEKIMKTFPGIRSIPTIKIFTPNGTEIDEIIGNAPSMKGRIKGLLIKHGLLEK
ncbi:TlpA family protein disulfide reductase [bacterium]|nr:TlpA family protein disulfide reductase [bacterium]